VADIFQEVDEEVRRERLKKLWDRYGNYVIAAAAIVVAAVAGWRGWDYWQSKRAGELGAQFDAALTLSEQGKHAEAEAAFSRVAADATAGYRVLARLQEAAERAHSDRRAAVAAYDALAADTSIVRPLRDLAGVRAGFLLVDTASLAEMTQRLEPLAVPDGPFRHSARELLALSAYRVGDAAAAKRWFDAITTDAEAPQGLRARIEVLRTLSGTDGKG
jgi:hypothetical protein